MSSLTYEEAKKAEGQTFTVVMDDNSELELTLQKVASRGSARREASGGERNPFTLTFKGAPGHYCEQKTYKLKNSTLGEQEIFIVPVACDDATDIFTYQAVFS